MPKPLKKQTWSNCDAFGVLNGLGIWDEQYKSLRYVRKPFETVLDLRDRIFDQHENEHGVDKQGLLNGICDEFGLTPDNVEDKKIFTLTYEPVISGGVGVADIKCYYKPLNSGTWIELRPQVWPSGYAPAVVNREGFIVWQKERSNNLAEIKNFTYSNIVEIIADLEDETDLKFVYYRYAYDDNNDRSLVLYTDMENQEDSDDERFTYRVSDAPSISGGAVVYNLNDIPKMLSTGYYYDYRTHQAKQFLYDLKNVIDRKFKHKWEQLQDNSTIWDIHKSYGSGEIPAFYDALIPHSHVLAGAGSYIESTETLTGGIEPMSDSLYLVDLIEADDGERITWKPQVFPGKFYLNGIPYYLFENPQTENLTFADGKAILPTGVLRGQYVILGYSGFWNDGMNDVDTMLSGNIYEDYNYPAGSAGHSFFNRVYRRVPLLGKNIGRSFIASAMYNYHYGIARGQYVIDYVSGYIYTNDNIPKTIIWDNILEPSGVTLPFDINPMNNSNLTYDKYFVYLSLNDVSRMGGS